MPDPNLDNLRDNIENIQEETRISVDFAKEFASALGRSSQTVVEISKTFSTTNKLTQNLLGHIYAAERGEFQIKTLSYDINKAKNIQASVQKEINKLSGLTASIERDVNDRLKDQLKQRKRLEKEIATQISAKGKADRSTEKELQSLNSSIKLTQNKLRITQDLNDYLSQQKRDLNDIVKGYEDIVKASILHKKQQDEINKATGLTGVILDSLFKTKLTRGLAKYMGLDSAKQAMHEFVEEQIKSGKAIDSTSLRAAALIKGLQGLKKGLISTFKDPMLFVAGLGALVHELYEIGIKTDDWATKFSRSLALSKNEAIDLVTNFREMSILSGDLRYTSELLMQAQFDLNKAQSIAVIRTEEELKLQTKLRNLEIQSASKLNTLTNITTKLHSKYVESVLQGAFQSMKANKIQFEAEEILNDIGRISNDILVNFRQNPIALGKAVAEAKRLGLTLQDINDIGNHLVDFQSSIASEMQAEVILGKQINLERARLAAFTNDQLTLTQEIKKNLPTLEEYTRLNKIQRESLAGFMGLNKEQLADIVTRTELEKKFGDISKLSLDQISKLASEQKTTEGKILLDKYSQLSVQEKFNAAMTRLQDIVARLVGGPVGKFLETLTSALETVDKIYSKVTKLGKAFGLGTIGSNIAGSIATFVTSAALLKLMLRGSSMAFPMWTRDAGKMAANAMGNISNALYTPTGYYQNGKRVQVRGKIPKGSKLNPGGFTGLGKGLGLAALLLEAGLITKDIYDETQKGKDLSSSIMSGLTKNIGTLLGATIGGVGGLFLGGPGGALVGAGLGSMVGGFLNPKEEDLPPMAKGGILTRPTKVLAGEAGPEAILPLKDNTVVDTKPIVDAINRLIDEVKKGGNIYMDGQKVGVALAKNNYRG